MLRDKVKFPYLEEISFSKSADGMRIDKPIPIFVAAGLLSRPLAAQLSKFQFLTPSRHARLVQVLLHHSRFLLTESRTRSA